MERDFKNNYDTEEEETMTQMRLEILADRTEKDLSRILNKNFRTIHDIIKCAQKMKQKIKKNRLL